MGSVGQHQSAQAQADAQNAAATSNYKYQLKVRERSWDREVHRYGRQLHQYDSSLQENSMAGQRAYSGAQRKLNSAYQQASLKQQANLVNLLKGSGQAAAAGRNGRSSTRLDNNIVSQFGRNQAIAAESLMGAGFAYNRQTDNIRREVDSSNKQAYEKVALAPQAGVAPPPPVMTPGPSGLSLAAGIVEAGVGGFQYIQLTQSYSPIRLIMEQDQLQTYEEGTAFKPGHTVDVIPSLDRINSRLNAADQEALAQVRRNNKTRVENSKQVGQDLIALSKMSKTLTDALVERQKGINEDEKAEGVIEGFNDYQAGKLDTQPLQEGLETAKQQDVVAQDVSSEVLGNSGENYEAAASIGKATTWREVGRRQGAAMAAVAGYDSFIDEKLSGMQFNSSAEYSAARASAQKAFIKEAGLSGVKPQFLATNVYPQMMKADAAANRKWAKQFAVDDSAKVRDELGASFSADIDVSSYLGAARNTVDSAGNPLGYKGAWDEFSTMVTEMRQAGMLSDGDIENMKSQPIPGDAKGRTYGELHAAKFENIQRQVDAQERTDWTNSQADRKMVFEKEEQAAIASFIDSADTDGFTDKQIDEVASALEAKYGMPASALRRLQTSSVDAEIRDQQEDQIKDLMKLNLLTPERLSKFDPKLQAKYASIAGQQAKLRKDNNNFEDQNKAIKEKIEFLVQLDKQSANDPAVSMMVSKMQQEYQQLVTKLAIGGNPDPANAALAEIFNKIDTATNQFGDNPKKITQFYRSQTIGQLSTATGKQQQKLSNINRVLLEGGADALSKMSIYTPEELTEITKNYGKPGWTTGAAIEYAADRLGIDPIAALNKQLELNGMEALPPTPAMEVVNKLTPQQQQLLNKYKTPERSARGFAGTGKYDPTVVPGGYGDAVFNAASAHNIPPSVLAGLIETESGWNPNAVSSAGAKGLGQFMPATAAEQGVNVFDPLSSIDGAAKYLSYLVDYFKGDMRLAIFAYNGGMGNIERYGGPIPGSQENQDYYGKVMRGAYKYGYGKQSLQDPAVMRPSIAAQIPR